MSGDRPHPGDGWRKRFYTIWVGQQTSQLGSAVAQFAIVWWLTARTGSATVLATATLVARLPTIVLGPFVGALVDRWNRKRVMILADGLVALASGWLALLFLRGGARVGHVYLVMFVRAVGMGFHSPAAQASVALMVPEERLPRIAGLNQALSGAALIIAPPLGALCLALMPLQGVMAIDVATALTAIIPLSLTRVPQPPASLAPVRPTLWQDVRAGLRYVRAWPELLLICGAATLVDFFIGPALALAPILVKVEWGGGAVQLGWINSAWGLGLVAVGLLLGAW
ncbi:MAG: MFS transporter, partial [Chloroflexota bacterium]